MQGELPATPRYVLGIVGRSGSGKTTLLEFLVSRLAASGLRVNVIKHSHHDLELEPPRKDSARMRAAGAAEVMVCSPYRFAIIHELRGAPEPGLDEQIARLGPCDLTLVEGFKAWPIPKLEVFRSDCGKPSLYQDDPGIVVVASDLPRPEGLRPGLLWLDMNAPEQVLEWITDNRKNFAFKP
jgi:molybdopterin-guanine dinucleotide biosynthesis adapter protein